MAHTSLHQDKRGQPMSVPQEYYDPYSNIQHTGRRKHAGQEVNRMSVLSESRQR